MKALSEVTAMKRKSATATATAISVGSLLAFGCAVSSADIESENEESASSIEQPLIDARLPRDILNPGRTPGGVVIDWGQISFPNIESFGVVKMVPAMFGTFRGMVPVPETNECLPVPRGEGATADRWGVSFSVRANGRALRRVRVCRLRDGAPESCFYDRAVGPDAANEGFVAVPDEGAPDPRASTLPRLRYRLDVETEGGGGLSRTLERKLAPLPQVTLRGPAAVQGPAGGPGRFHTSVRDVTFANARHLAVVSVRSSDASASSISLLEDASTLAGSPPSPLYPVSHRRDPQTTSMCDSRSLSASGFRLWSGAGFPVRIWAQAPLIEGCQLTALSEQQVSASFRDTAPIAVFTCSPRDPEAPVWTGPSGDAGADSGASDGGVRDGGADASTCVEGASCTARPSECNAAGTVFEVRGRTRCVSGRAVCEPAERYCNTCGGDCGGCSGNRCQEGAPSLACAPGAVCGRTSFPGCDSRYEVCGQCAAIPSCNSGAILCWKPMRADGTWPDRPTDAAFCGVDTGTGGACRRQCDGSNCGNDGCGGSCGTCASGQACEARSGTPYGGRCLPSTCTRDSDCCTRDDESCTELGRRRCAAGRCTSTF